MSSDDDAIDWILARIDDAIARLEAETLDAAHIVYVFDADLGVASAYGPFPTPQAACVAAEDYVREAVAAGSSEGDLQVKIVPLEPADPPSTAAVRPGPES